MNLDIKSTRDHLQAFDFINLFVEDLGWNRPKNKNKFPFQIQEETFYRQEIAELSGVVVYEITSPNGLIPDSKTRAIVSEEIQKIKFEHLVIFVDQYRTQSIWRWLKSQQNKNLPREHAFYKGQTGDLFISKLAGLFTDINELENNLTLLDVTKKIKNAFDVEKITKKFFKEFETKHGDFVQEISGIDHEKHRAWYASVLLHRLMFIWFLQKKHFLDHGNGHYLVDQLKKIQQVEKNQYYQRFLKPLFFEGFAKPEQERSQETNQLLGHIVYLNGGLFLPHQIEEMYPNIQVTDQAFEALFVLFSNYSWNLDDSLNGKDNEINPDVLGYIFEKYINQKQFGAYYTRPEITDYLSEQTIYKLLLDKINLPAIPELNWEARQFKDISDLLLKLDAPLCQKLLFEILPNLSILDPACGSGAFLVAAMKTLINVYAAIIGKINFLNNTALNNWLKNAEKAHKSIHYFIKKQIITNNLYGVDIMPEAMEIAKLRLFLALVSSAQTVEQLEPLPNIDFNIMAGNSLIGLLHVDEKSFEQQDLFSGKSYRQVLIAKNEMIANYKDATTYNKDLGHLRNYIADYKRKDYVILNHLLLEEFSKLKIQFEQATWDDKKNKEGKPIKRLLTLEDIEQLQPFHWGYEFDQIFEKGGFDAIITNPPWEVFKPQAKEFFADYSEWVTKNKMTIKDFEKEKSHLLSNPETKTAWLNYQSQFSFVSLYFRNSLQYQHQTAVVNGKKTGSDINLYKLFAEQCFNLLKEKGECGIVIPSGIYTDLGTTGLRNLLFNQTNITGLFCFENNKLIFEGVHRSFKFVVLTFVKTKDHFHARTWERENNQSFPVAFMRHEVSELTDFPNAHSLKLSIDLIKKLSPDSFSIMEFKTPLDIHIAEKMLKFPLLGETLGQTWNLKLTNEFHMTNDSHLFKTENAVGRLPLYEGKMIHQFTHLWGDSKPKYWIDETEGRKALLGKKEDSGEKLDYQCYRLAYRAIASSTNERALIATIIPPCFTGNSVNISKQLDSFSLLICVSFFNSFVADWLLRQKVSANINMFYVYQLPIPRLGIKDEWFKEIVEKSAGLICTTEEFEDLRKALEEEGFEIERNKSREQLRAELDAIVAVIYGLTEEELEHILSTFPLVEEDIKRNVLVEFRLLSKSRD
ncbi:MAG: hypothetical protein RIT27_1249 [Pseudomonadota bacterium]|jgi:hypothetical protein